MKKFFLILFLALDFATAVRASLVYQGGVNPNQPMSEYFQAAYPNYDKSVIFIFFNNNPCYDCAETVELIEQIYNKNYADKYSLFLINYKDDQEYDFITAYNLNQTLEVVLQKVEDGMALGYTKLENLQNQISDPVSFADYLTYQIDSFFGND